MEIFRQDYRLKKSDLNITFFSVDVAYPYSGLPFKYSPYWVRYELGELQDITNAYYPMGSIYRLPDEVSTGVYRPNFIIGHDWKTGTYRLVWKYKKEVLSPVERLYVDFRVVTSGIYDNTEVLLGGYRDLPAELNVIA